MTSQNVRDAIIQRPAPAIAAAHLGIGVVWLIAGVSLGINMAVSHDFVLRPVHAHANLLGWATNALFGCFYWLRGSAPRLPEWLGWAAYNAGGAILLVALTSILLDSAKLAFLMPIGMLLVAIGILQFAWAIFGTGKGARA